MDLEPAEQGQWRHVPRVAWGLWGLSMSLATAGLVFLALSYDVDIGERWGIRGGVVVFAVAFSTVGALIVSRRPRNRIGWMLTVAGLLSGLQALVEEYATFAYRGFPDLIRAGGEPALWLAGWLWLPSATLVWVFVPLLYPDGQLLSRRWRIVVAMGIVGATALLVCFAFSPVFGRAFPKVPAPYALQGADQVFDGLSNVGNVAVTGTILAALVSLIIRYRRSLGDGRQQIKWLAFAVVPLVLLVPLAGVPGVGPFVMLATVGVPVATGIAILRYRLYDIDLLINRSLVYGSLTIVLLAILGGSVLLISQLAAGFAGGPLVAVAISAAAFGAVFQPARRGLQRFVDQKFYNIRIDYQKTPPDLLGAEGLTQVIRQTRFAQYRSLALIGRGGMAEVYRAQHPSLDQAVAIKLLPPQLAISEEFRSRFVREGQTVKGLRHENIVRVFDYGEDGGTHFIVMELLSGPDLGQHLKTRGRLTMGEARPIVRDVASALDYAHARGLVHRDIKPTNVMLDSGSAGDGGAPRAVLTDFGIAKILDARTRLTQTAGALGTLGYIAPEQIHAAADVDGRADVYSLGVLTYQLLTGELPFKQQAIGALILAHLNHPPPDASEQVPDLPRNAARAMQRAMAKEPKERFATAGEFAAALGQ